MISWRVLIPALRMLSMSSGGSERNKDCGRTKVESMTRQISCTKLNKEDKKDAWPYRDTENVEMGGFCSTLMEW